MEDGRAAVEGETTIPGVSGTGAPVDLEFLDPGGAGTGTLLPTGNVLDLLEVEGAGSVPVSLVDAANPFVFVDASDVGITGTEMPVALDARPEVMERIERVRAAAAVAMGIAASPAEASSRFPSAPKIGIAAPPRPATTLRGESVKAAEGDLTARMVSMNNVHRALPLTGVLGFAVAAAIEGTVVARVARPRGCRRRRSHPAHQSLRGDHGCRRGAPHRRRRGRLACRSCFRAPDPAPAVRRFRLRAGRPGAGARRPSRPSGRLSRTAGRLHRSGEAERTDRVPGLARRAAARSEPIRGASRNRRWKRMNAHEKTIPVRAKRPRCHHPPRPALTLPGASSLPAAPIRPPASTLATAFALAAVVLLAAFATPAREQMPPTGEFPKTDFDKRIVDLSEIMSGGPPRDGIPAVDEPRYTSTEDAGEWLDPDEREIRLGGVYSRVVVDHTSAERKLLSGVRGNTMNTCAIAQV